MFITLNATLRPVPFGRAEGVAVYLNGTDLPDEVYESDPDELTLPPRG
jgi:hypothetical protein